MSLNNKYMVWGRDICETCKYFDKFTSSSDEGYCKNENVVGSGHPLNNKSVLDNDWVNGKVQPEGTEIEGVSFKGCFGCIFHERKDAKKIIFLDRDGVLVTNGYQKKAIELLNKLTDETDASIVISASFRSGGLTDCRKELMDNGVTGDIIDTTPLSRQDIRGKNIDDYVKRKGFYYPIEDWDAPAWQEGRDKCIIESYVIIDDDKDMLMDQEKHYVGVDGQKGFIENHQFERAIEILNKDFRV